MNSRVNNHARRVGAPCTFPIASPTAGARLRRAGRRFCSGAGLVAFVVFVFAAPCVLAAPREERLVRDQPGLMHTKEGRVLLAGTAGAEALVDAPQPLAFGDSLRTLRFSRAAVIFEDRSEVRLSELTRLQIIPRAPNTNTPAVRLFEGPIYVLSRGAPRSIAVEAGPVRGVPEGTEFLVEVKGEQAVFTMFDGQVELDNGREKRRLGSGFQAIARAGEPIQVRPILEAQQILQWWIDYPGVLHLEDLGFTPMEAEAHRESMVAYRAGDLRRALETFPAGPALPEGSPAMRVFYSGLTLAVGSVETAQALLEGIPDTHPAARALRIMVHAVAPPLTREVPASFSASGLGTNRHFTASEWLALSYAHQASNDLAGALNAARASVNRAPDFGFGWARVAELEFSFGRTRAAQAAVQQALELAPRHAQAQALRGFLLAARNQFDAALAAFDQAIALDPSLGNAWLGRGLVRIRRGQTTEGQRDLETATILEPRRSVIRSYMGKAYAEAGLAALARKELAYAQQLDPNDPTAWLYSALLEWEQHSVNRAVRDLERSIELNQNRALFRSQLLLDQDRAVRGANLARIYSDAGLAEVSVREAARALTADYANYSAHLFLANSYNELRDPRQINLRHETPWFTEYLLANLLAPVSAGPLSPAISQQEYSKLFERDRLGLVSQTDYSSRGDWSQSAAQYGVVGNLGYALEGTYREESLDRRNGDSEQRLLSLQVKQQITPDTTLYVQAVDARSEAGDLRPYYDPGSAFPRFDLRERQSPLLLAGVHHQWSPEHHTLLLSGRLEDRLAVNNAHQPVLLLFDDGAGRIEAVAQPALPTARWLYRSELEIYPVELQHLWRAGEHQFTVGVRYQFGTFDTQSRLGESTPAYPGTNTSIVVSTEGVSQELNADFDRFNTYVYDHWQILDSLLLIGGVSYDRVEYPGSYRTAPLRDDQDQARQLSPKAGFIWDITSQSVLRGAYTRSLGGVSLDQSVRLEPAQVAGFSQAYRSLIPEAVAGANAAARFETWGLALDQKFGRGTFVGLQGEWLRSEVDRQVGVIIPQFGPQLVTTTGETIEYQEQSIQLTLHQLVGEIWSFGARYRWSRAELETRFPAIPPAAWSYAQQDLTAYLHEVRLFARAQLSNGLFAHIESLYLNQDNDGYRPELPGDDLWQLNAYVGYRFPQRRAELRVGVLNLTDQDYRLNPLNLMNELPRERTFVASLRIAL